MSDLGSINKVILLGYLGVAPDLQKNLNTGGKFCVLSVATKEYFKPGPNGKKKPPLTTWHKCIVYGQAAENIVKFGQKGTLVAINGKLRRKAWQAEDGERRVNTQIVVEELTVVGGKIKHQLEDPPEENPEQEDLDLKDEEIDPY